MRKNSLQEIQVAYHSSFCKVSSLSFSNLIGEYKKVFLFFFKKDFSIMFALRRRRFRKKEEIRRWREECKSYRRRLGVT